MTDARLQGDWLAALRFASLSDVGWRVFCGALMWSAEQGTDGAIPERFLRSLHPSLDPQPSAYAELEAAGMWSKVDDGYQLIGWADRDGLGQSTAEQVRAYREGSRSRQQRYRDRKRGANATSAGAATPSGASAALATPNVTRDITPNVGRGFNKGLSTTEGAYVADDITRNASPAPTPTCSKHPNGTDSPCGACARAREAYEAWKNRPLAMPLKSGECRHRSVHSNRCDDCGRLVEAIA